MAAVRWSPRPNRVESSPAVAAAITLPVGADSGARTSKSDELATFTSWLRAHGLGVPSDLEPMALKLWMHDHVDRTAG